jgi:hypothetical protein
VSTGDCDAARGGSGGFSYTEESGAQAARKIEKQSGRKTGRKIFFISISKIQSTQSRKNETDGILPSRHRSKKWIIPLQSRFVYPCVFTENAPVR